MIGKRLKEIRKKIALTQTELGNILGTSMRAIQNWESENRKIPESAIKLLEAKFNINPEWLKTGNGNMFRDEFNGQYAVGHNIIQSNGNHNIMKVNSLEDCEITDEMKELCYLIKNYASPKLIKDFKEKLMKIKEIQDSE